MAPIALKIGTVTAAAIAALGNDSVELPATATRHHDEVVAWIKRIRLVDKFNILPPGHEFTFWPIRNGIRGAAIVDVKLFCGENPAYQTWAIVDSHPTNKVEFVNEYYYGKVETVAEPSKLALMYPFKALKKSGNKALNIMLQMRQLVRYLFLVNGHLIELAPKTYDHLGYLSSAIDCISKVYEAKGIENVPNLHPPSEDLSIVRENNGVRPGDQPAPPLYDDDVKSVISEESDDGAKPEDEQVPGKMVAQAPAVLNDNDNVESWLENPAARDNKIPATFPKNDKKRARENDDNDDNYDKYRQLIKDRQELDKLKADHEDKLKRREANLAVIARRQADKEDELDALLARSPAKEMGKWLKRTL